MERNQSLKTKLTEESEVVGVDSPALESRLAGLKTELANKSTEVTDLERKLDNIPSSHELQQYQKRFLELDNELAAEFSATQRYITMYNTLLDQKTFTEKAIGQAWFFGISSVCLF